MSNDRDSTIDKFSSETCRIGRSKTLAVLAKSKKNKPSQKESPFLNLRKNSDKAFKAQIVPQSFPHNNTLSVLEHRLSSNLAILVPLLKRSCPNNLLQIERLDSGGKLIRENPEQPEVNKKLQAPCSLPPSRHPQISSSPSLHNHHRRKKRRQVLYSILPIALSSQLLPRSNNLSQLSSRQNFGENFSAGEKGSVVSKEECEQNYNKNDHKQGDTLDFHKVNKNDLSVETEPLDVLPSRQKHIIKQLRVRDLSPVVSCGGKIGLAVPTCLSQTCVDTRTVKAHIRRQLTLQSGWKTSRRLGLNRFSSSKKSLALPLLSGSNKSSSSHSSLLSYSTESVCSSESMSSTSHPAKQPKAPTSLHMTKPMAVSEHHSHSNLSSSFNMPIANLGHMTVHGKTHQLRNSRSFHGDGGNGITTSIVRATQGIGKDQSGNNTTSNPVRQSKQERKLLDRQRIKTLKPLSVTKAQGNHTRLRDLGQADFSAAILPDSGTASYRLTNDVSFDEGSRYKGVGNAFTAFGPPSEEQKNPIGNRRRNTQGNSDGQSGPTSQNSRFEKLSDSGNRGRLTPAGHVTTGGYKETVPMSLIRIEERLNFDPPQGRHQSPGYLSPPVPGSRGNSANGGSNLTSSSLSANTASMSTFRQNRDRENWSYKVGNLSVNGGGYYGSSPVLPGARADTSGIGSLSLNSTSNLSQKFSQGREKNGNSNKSRLSSRYGSRYETTSAKDGGFADPCINPPSSFQQRLTELSMLESDTIKYERNRKLKRKSKQDKDS